MPELMDGARAAPGRGPSVVDTLRDKLSPLLERVHRINNNLTGLCDRAYGENPATNQRGDPEIKESPPYGGAMAEMYYLIDRLEDAVAAAERSANRVDGLA